MVKDRDEQMGGGRGMGFIILSPEMNGSLKKKHIDTQIYVYTHRYI